jgi:hypothetical protein
MLQSSMMGSREKGESGGTSENRQRPGTRVARVAIFAQRELFAPNRYE